MKCASLLSVFAFGFASAFSAATLAQSAPRSTFESLDTDRDGFVTRQEAARLPLLYEGFHIADRNRNGLLERPELEEAISISPPPAASGGATAAPADPSQLFRRLDRNRDGYLSDEELSSNVASRWNWIASDRDGDGRFSPSEFEPINQR